MRPFNKPPSTMRLSCAHNFGTRQLTTMNFKFLMTFLCFCTVSVRAEERRRQPNVIFVLADDLGIGDLEPTNPDCRIKTPHLKTMANEGITFLDAHSSSAVCTPTRYGVLTGRYNWRSRLARVTTPQTLIQYE